jgi:hypothetical protein
MKGISFQQDDNTFIIEGVDFESNEIPLLYILRSDVIQYKDNDYTEWSQFPEQAGYYTKDERPYQEFASPFMNHTGWDFYPGGRYAWNIPDIKNGELIGYYWMPLTSIIQSIIIE